MKHCLFCNNQFNASYNACSNCASFVACVDGFVAYAPEFAHEAPGFKASYFSKLASLEDANFWFRARNAIIVWALNKYAPNLKSFFEIGCGTGYVLNEVSKHFPEITLNGSDIFTEGLKFAAKRLPSANLMQMDARRIPFINEFDAIGAFDVLEHIKEDDIALSQMYKALKPDGVLFLTVPQHMWLWSAADECALHERRYAAAELPEKVIDAGFTILESTSFITSLLPVMMLSRLCRGEKGNSFDPLSELKINRIVNMIFELILRFEHIGIKLGINYPVGGSRLVIAKKNIDRVR